jgi:colanic acid/amylovoran biosynthesis glycosyltransferase
MTQTRSGDAVRLAYLVPEFPTQTHAFFWREICALRERGMQVDLFSTRRPPVDACRHEFAESARAQTHYLFPPRFGTALGFLLAHPLGTLRALRYIAALRESPVAKRGAYLGLVVCAADLARECRKRGLEHLHVHSCADAAHVAALCRALGGLPYSLTLHGDLEVYGRDHASKTRGASFVAAVTRPLCESMLRELALASGRVQLVRMGVDTERFAPRARRVPEDSALRLVTVARLHPNKGHRFALRAMQRLRRRGVELHYTLVGAGDERGALEREVAELGLSGDVCFAGSRGEAEVAEILVESDVYVLPSVAKGEAAPVSIMEAMASGLPVVSSQIGGVDELVRDGVDGLLVPQGDPDALAEAIASLSLDKALRERLGAAARARAVAEFHYRTHADRLLALVRGSEARL